MAFAAVRRGQLDVSEVRSKCSRTVVNSIAVILFGFVIIWMCQMVCNCNNDSLVFHDHSQCVVLCCVCVHDDVFRCIADCKCLVWFNVWCHVLNMIRSHVDCQEHLHISESKLRMFVSAGEKCLEELSLLPNRSSAQRVIMRPMRKRSTNERTYV